MRKKFRICDCTLMDLNGQKMEGKAFVPWAAQQGRQPVVQHRIEGRDRSRAMMVKGARLRRGCGTGKEGKEGGRGRENEEESEILLSLLLSLLSLSSHHHIIIIIIVCGISGDVSLRESRSDPGACPRRVVGASRSSEAECVGLPFLTLADLLTGPARISRILGIFAFCSGRRSQGRAATSRKPQAAIRNQRPAIC